MPGCQSAKPTVRQLKAWLKPLDRRLRQTLTFDNGTEFAQHVPVALQM